MNEKENLFPVYVDIFQRCQLVTMATRHKISLMKTNIS